MDFRKIKHKIFKQWRWLVLVILSICFFIGTASYSYLTQEEGFVKWSSPDETANYTFAKLYAQEGDMRFFEKNNLYVEDIIHPRSMKSEMGKIKPVSFLGIILVFGKIASLTSYKVLPYLTPLFGAVGIIFFYLLVKKIFGRRNAFISAFLLASFPVYIYYCARSMFHNVLFIVFLIIGLYYLVLMAKDSKKKEKFISWCVSWRSILYPALSGIFIGLASITRTSELIWVLPMLLVLWLFNIRKIGVIKIIVFLSFLFLSILPVLFWNQVLYGAHFSSGYYQLNESVGSIVGAGSDIIKGTAVGELSYHKELLGKIKDNVFYFGFNFNQSIKMFYYYFVKMFFWIFWPAVLVFIIYL